MAYRKPPKGYTNPEPTPPRKLRDIEPWEHVARRFPDNDDRMSLTYGLRRVYRLRVLA